jgi:hypothetical protein
MPRNTLKGRPKLRWFCFLLTLQLSPTCNAIAVTKNYICHDRAPPWWLSLPSPLTLMRWRCVLIRTDQPCQRGNTPTPSIQLVHSHSLMHTWTHQHVNTMCHHRQRINTSTHPHSYQHQHHALTHQHNYYVINSLICCIGNCVDVLAWWPMCWCD